MFRDNMAEISSIATQSPETLAPTAPLSTAIDLMAKRGFRRIPIVFDYQLVGIITASDVIRVIYEGNSEIVSKEIFNFMTEQPIMQWEDLEITEAIKFMQDHDLSALPLVSVRDQILTGIVTERDLVSAFVDSIADADLDGFINENPLKMALKGKTVGHVIKAMIKNSTSRIIFVNTKKTVQGILTVKDIIKFIHNEIIVYGNPAEDIMSKPIDDLVSKDIQCVNMNTSVAEVAKFMVEKKIGGVPVINDDNKFVGMFSERDILSLIATYGLI